MNYGNDKNIVPRPLTKFEAVSGRGIRTQIDQTEYLAGNTAFMEECGISASAVQQRLGELADQGKTPLLFAANDEIIGMIAVADVEKGEQPTGHPTIPPDGHRRHHAYRR